ncbi:head GIN domain-containing protein [Halpernia frigidisoli]|uniref:Putative auto-transporter adhesin, head GIN domain n=1 Tax=Halpernia frigidisoli TaxID=1125876 RepID=A0A1I3DAK1_9FLAO|nr:head GIN domain-containing protein [Halpernia frigidisoli]SFH83676.1 Putative auto-transporter adhesin, head GIN domain [Halpernia frigidisoli]
MKTNKILFLIPFALLTSCSIKINDKGQDSDSMGNLFSNSKSINGTGDVQEKTYNLSFDELKVSSSINAEVIKSDVEKIVISAPSDLLNEVWVEQSGNKVHIHFKPNLNIRNSDRVKATIYAKDFSKLSASSSGIIVVKDKFTQDNMDIDVSSSGSIEGDLEANNLNLQISSSGDFKGKLWAVDFSGEISSSGDATISGSSTNSKFRVSSSGKLDARNFTTKNADLQASSSGDIAMKVSNTLNASASSSGGIDIQKTGNLNIQNRKESSGGSVNVR